LDQYGIIVTTTVLKPCLLVENTLQNKEFPFIFGAGDCVTLRNYSLLPKNGVYAVRQGPILWENLKRTLNNQSLITFKSQKKFLSILSIGDKQGLLTYGRLSFHGYWAWNKKFHRSTLHE
jgi:NADH dehydrogenase FAD-containing subunit